LRVIQGLFLVSLEDCLFLVSRISLFAVVIRRFFFLFSFLAIEALFFCECVNAGSFRFLVFQIRPFFPLLFLSVATLFVPFPRFVVRNVHGLSFCQPNTLFFSLALNRSSFLLPLLFQNFLLLFCRARIFLPFFELIQGPLFFPQQ